MGPLKTWGYVQISQSWAFSLGPWGIMGGEKAREMAKVPGRRGRGPGSLARLVHFSPPVTHPFLHLHYYHAHFTEGK